jgi:hypothetical protein
LISILTPASIATSRLACAVARLVCAVAKVAFEVIKVLTASTKASNALQDRTFQDKASLLPVSVLSCSRVVAFAISDALLITAPELEAQLTAVSQVKAANF